MNKLAEQLCEPKCQLNCVNRGGRFDTGKTGLNPPVIITDRPKAVLIFGAIHFLNVLNVLILTLLCVEFIKFS